MRFTVAVLLLLLVSFFQSAPALASTNCSKHVTTTKLPELRTQILASLDNAQKLDCLSKAYKKSLGEAATQSAKRLQEAGCSVNSKGAIYGNCKLSPQEKKKIESLADLDQELKEILRDKIDASQNKRNEEQGKAERRRDAADCTKRPERSVADIRKAICCGTDKTVGGAVRAIEPGLSYNSCLGKTQKTSKEFTSVSGVVNCVGNAIGSALKTLWNNLKSIIKLPAELWAARSQIWQLMTNSQARAKFAKAMMSQLKAFFADRVKAMGTCYNDYEANQFYCKMSGQVIGMIATPGTITPFLSLAAKPLGVGAKIIGNLLEKSPSGRSVAGKLNQMNSAASRGVAAARKGMAPVASSAAVTAARKGIRGSVRVLTYPAEKIAKAIEQSSGFKALMAAAYKSERRTASENKPIIVANTSAVGTAAPQKYDWDKWKNETVTPTAQNNGSSVATESPPGQSVWAKFENKFAAQAAPLNQGYGAPSNQFKTSALAAPLERKTFDNATVYQGGQQHIEPALEYDLQMAKLSGLETAEVIALRKNFAATIPDTGETGVFRVGDKLVLDPNANVIGAYTKFSNRLKTGKPLTGQDFIDVRINAYDKRSVDGDTRPIPFKFKDKFTATIPKPISPYVQERLKHYGIDFEIRGGKTKIFYSESPRGPPLDQLADDVNKMIADGHPPERIATFVAQDLSILHPFKDGNGRTARVMGQAMYKHLTGKTAVFPESFHREMEYSVDELATKILPSAPKKAASAEDYVTLAYAQSRNVPVTLPKSAVESKAPRNDVNFPNEFSMGGRKVRYDELSPSLKAYDKPVFYGVPGGTLASAEDKVMKVMSFGRGTRGKAHYDLSKHLSSTARSEGPSGFFPTSKDSAVAARFANTPTAKSLEKNGNEQFGVVFIIDPRGAQVLRVDEFLESKKLPNGLFEGEVVFGERLNPSRIQAAAIVDRFGNTVKVIRNPAYVPQNPNSPTPELNP